MGASLCGLSRRRLRSRKLAFQRRKCKQLSPLTWNATASPGSALRACCGRASAARGRRRQARAGSLSEAHACALGTLTRTRGAREGVDRVQAGHALLRPYLTDEPPSVVHATHMHMNMNMTHTHMHMHMHMHICACPCHMHMTCACIEYLNSLHQRPIYCILLCSLVH